ncbi:MAG: hypothetical protein IJ776_00565 [Paludibacteraceae bacterium]|nr:hypothetical protein [Paludibacteraceae bacterium]
MKFSVYQAPVSNTVPAGTLTAEELFKVISGKGIDTPRLAGLTRCVINAQNEYNTAILLNARGRLSTKELQRRKGLIFPYVTIGGVFSPTRKADNLQRASGLLTIDIDHLTDTESVFHQLAQDQLLPLVLLFHSPTAGIKIVLDINRQETPYSQTYTRFANYLYTAYGITSDPAPKNIAAATYIPYDPDCIYKTTVLSP